MDQSKQLKFPVGSRTTVTILSMGMEEDDFGSNFVVHIKETIEGYNHFNPSEGLQKKITEKNIGADDTIVIEKVPPSEKYQYGYFNVETAQNPPATIEAPKEPVVEEAQSTSRDDRVDVHELSVRLEVLEAKVLKLEKDALPF